MLDEISEEEKKLIATQVVEDAGETSSK